MELLNDENSVKVGAQHDFGSMPNFEDDFDDSDDVVVRHPRHSSRFLLADGGDGAEADLLGTTPPRSRIRNKEIRKNNIDTDRFLQRAARGRRVSEYTLKVDTSSPVVDRLKKRASQKLYRSRERDWKQDQGQRDHRADSLPATVMGPGAEPAVPTLVESCSRFMCLTSRLKSRESNEVEKADAEPDRWCAQEEELPPSRVTFHKTFSMLINMGNMEKGCRRTISREEQVWQNELKDLIWLELQAKIAGRTLAQQDTFLCAQRKIVPTIVQNVIDYRFVNPNPCRYQPRRLRAVEGSREDLSSDYETKEESVSDSEENSPGCVSFNCRECTDAIGKAMKEIGTLLDSFYNAVALYPSTKAMTVEHPLIATQLFKNRLKAMCLWYNTALHMRLKMLSVRRMVRQLTRKRRARLDNSSRQSSTVETPRPSQVRFNMSDKASDSSNSGSCNSDTSKEDKWPPDAKINGNKSDEEKPHEDEVEYTSPSAIVDRPSPPTPEIVISDSKYGTADTSVSSESGYTSSASTADEAEAGLCELGDISDLLQLRLLGRCKESPYREYHSEMLKTQGVRRCLMFINKMREHVLHKVHVTLEKHSSPSEVYQEEATAQVFDDTKDDEEKTEPPRDDQLEKTYELKRFGCWSEESVSMRLPSYRSHFLLLSAVCMEAVHDYLTLRLEARPERPSCLTVKQLIHELKEGLDISTEMRHDFVRNVEVALEGVAVSAEARTDLLQVLRTYDTTVESVLKQYLSYLRTMSETEHMSRAWLHSEWAFTARLARRVKCAALLAPITFTDISCNQITTLLADFKKKFDLLVLMDNSGEHPPNRATAYRMCRAVQAIYARGREPLLHAAQWARLLAAKLARAPATAFAAQRDQLCDKLMSMREFTMSHTKLVLERTRVPDEELDLTEGLLTRVRELLLQMFKLGFELHREMYKVAVPPRKPEGRRERPATLQPQATRDHEFGFISRKRPDTIIVHESINPLIHKEVHRAVTDVPSRMFSQPRRSLVSSPPKALRPKFARSESVAEDSVFDDKLFENLNCVNYNEGIVRLLSGEDAAPEPVQLRSGNAAHEAQHEQRWAALVARAVIEFAICWMRFVVERCDRGRGLRPRWASQGLEFLMLACDPCNTKHLSEEEFEELKQLMDGCISHVVGSRPLADAVGTPRPRARLQKKRRKKLHSLQFRNDLKTSLQSPSPTSPGNNGGGGGGGGGDLAPPTPPSEPDPLHSFQAHDHAAHIDRVCSAIHSLEENRDKKLRELKTVGRVVEVLPSYEPKLKQVTFKWQRGLKIGAGTFGKVYTVVNTESGQLLAMKELSIGAGDRRALQRAANELRVLEGVLHPHLVRYYGCELHREEMLIFMELCVEGSLEALVATSGALAEQTVRRYAKQLVSAVMELHSRNIAHRDIKSGNIFLTNEGHCLKLGDFGCAVKIRANTTAPGELQGFVGTQAYMAPEVFMKSSGHGRAADVWSLGCVVVEMASGKRPFSECDSNYQIMFVVGMGGRPEPPASLSPEGVDFCALCLQHDPDTRARADELALHHFLLVKSDEDCKCEPAYLIT